MPENSKEKMDEAINRAKKEVAEEVETHKAEDNDLEKVSGGTEELWEIGFIYKTTSSS